MTQDDIDASKAPLLEHLIELRQHLMRAIVAIFIAFIVCFYLADEIFSLLVIPYERAAGSDQNIRLIYTAPQEYCSREPTPWDIGAASRSQRLWRRRSRSSFSVRLAPAPRRYSRRSVRAL